MSLEINVKRYRNWVIVASLALMLLAASPTLVLFIQIPSNSVQFSDLWYLGSSHKAEDYPYNIKINETYRVHVGVGNYLGYSEFYRIFVKLGNRTETLSSYTNATTNLPALYEFDFFLHDRKVWETPVDFKFSNIEQTEDTIVLKNLSINDATFDVNSSCKWDELRSGFYYRLFFELWLYNMTLRNFQNDNRVVWLWLNATI